MPYIPVSPSFIQDSPGYGRFFPWPSSQDGDAMLPAFPTHSSLAASYHLQGQGLNTHSAFPLFPVSPGSIARPVLQLPVAVPTPRHVPPRPLLAPEGLPPTSASSSATNVRLLKCINCDYVTPDVHVLMEHLDSHYPVKTFLCVYCYQSFQGRVELNQHLQLRQCQFMGK